MNRDGTSGISMIVEISDQVLEVIVLKSELSEVWVKVMQGMPNLIDRKLCSTLR